MSKENESAATLHDTGEETNDLDKILVDFLLQQRQVDVDTLTKHKDVKREVDDRLTLHKNAKQALLQREQRLRAEIEKSYGGCHKCYGKGYATVMDGTIAYADLPGDKTTKSPITTKMKYCTCERGKALAGLSGGGE